METIATALLTSVGGTGAVLAIAALLGKKWVGTRIEESIKHEYAKELAEHKAQLAEQVNRSLNQLQAESKEADALRDADLKLFGTFLKALPTSQIEFMNGNEYWCVSKKNFDVLYGFRLNWERPEPLAKVLPSCDSAVPGRYFR